VLGSRPGAPGGDVSTSTARRPGLGEGRFKQAFFEFAYGLTGYEFAQEAIQARAAMETLFMTVVVGDMVGVPVLPPYYSLRLLPYVVPEVSTWKRRILREKEVTEEYDLHGV
jgi:hypothetical protein